MVEDKKSVPVYFIGHVKVTDREKYHEYEKGFFPILKNYDARFITYDDNPILLEGSRAEGRTVMIEFASEDEFRKWWDSPEYRELMKMRHAGTEAQSIFVLRGQPSR